MCRELGIADRVVERRLRFIVVLVAFGVVGCVADGQETGGAGIPSSTAFPAATTVTPPMSTTTQTSTTTPPRSTSELGEVFCDQPTPEPGSGEMVVTLYEVCEEGAGTGERLLAGLQPVERLVPAADVAVVAALEALLAGPTPEEEAAGFGSSFSSATAQALLDVAVGTDGVAVIDLDRESITGIDNVSTTTAGDYFRGQLYGTVFAFADVTTARFSLDGSSSGFCLMMELVPECVPVTRSQWDALYSQTVER